MRSADVPGVAKVDAESFPTHWSVQSYRNELQNPNALYLVAKRDGEVIGYAGMWVSADEAHITMLAVLRGYRRRGIGRRLLAALLRRARALGCTAATLEVRTSNTAAKRLYEQFRFVHQGTRPRYYADNNEDADIMWLHALDAEEYDRVLDQLGSSTDGLNVVSRTGEKG